VLNRRVDPLWGREGAKTKLGFVFLPAGVGFAGLQGGLNPRRKGITGGWFRRGGSGGRLSGLVGRVVGSSCGRRFRPATTPVSSRLSAAGVVVAGGSGVSICCGQGPGGGGAGGQKDEHGRRTDGTRTAEAVGLTKTHVLISALAGWAVRPESICGGGLSRVHPSRCPSLGAGWCENETRFRFFARRRWVCDVSG
jgi:hypothetical protein